MKALRVIALLGLAVVLFASVTSVAFAGSSGSVYGEATEQPVLSIVLSGTGSSGSSPFTFYGNSGTTLGYEGALTVTNDGQAPCTLGVQYGSKPIDINTDTWEFGTTPSFNTAVWEMSMNQAMISPVKVPSEGGITTSFGDYNLLPLSEQSIYTQFTFPTSFTNALPHTFSAIIVALPASDPI